MGACACLSGTCDNLSDYLDHALTTQERRRLEVSIDVKKPNSGSHHGIFQWIEPSEGDKVIWVAFVNGTVTITPDAMDSDITTIVFNDDGDIRVTRFNDGGNNDALLCANNGNTATSVLDRSP